MHTAKFVPANRSLICYVWAVTDHAYYKVSEQITVEVSGRIQETLLSFLINYTRTSMVKYRP